MRTFVLITAVLLAASSAFGAVFVPFDGVSQNGGLNVITTESATTSATLEFTANGIYTENSFADGNSYTRLFWDNSGVEGATGAPEIPVYRFLLEIPWGAEISIQTQRDEVIEYSLADLNIEGRILPVQPPLEKIPGAYNPFEMNQRVYSAGYSDNPVAEVLEYAEIRGRQVAVVIVRPVNYNPGENSIRIHQNLTLRFNLTGGDFGQMQENAARYNNAVSSQFVDGLIANPGAFETDPLPGQVLYMVICADNPDYVAALQPLIEWKRSKGYLIHFVTTAETGNSNTEIRDYILEAYNTWVIPPTYVLLAGDTPQIPHWTGQGTGSPGTDLPYGDLDGVYWTPEVYVSRFSPGNAGHLQNMVNKTLEYEQVLWTGNDDWEKYAVFMASNDNWSVSEGTHNYVISNYLAPDGYNYDRLYCHTYSATTQQVTNSFNAGRSQGTYSGHGSTTSWADGPPFSQANVLALTNAVYPFVQSYACLTGQFQLGECFGETWTRVPHGALVFMGASVSSYWGEDDIMEKRLYEGFFDNQTPGDPINYTWIAGMIGYAKIGLYMHYGNTGMIRRYCEMYNILGDGSCDVWTDVPQQVTVNHPPVVYLGTDQITVDVSGYPDWAMVCAYSTSEENVWDAQYVDDATGSVTLYFEPPAMPGEMAFTVTGHDVEPYVASVPLTPAAGPYVVIENCEVNDDGGWLPNSQADYDETVLLDVCLQNVGVEDAIGVNATITSEDEYATILNGTAAFGDIGANSTVTVASAYQIALSPEVPDEHAVVFDIEAVTATAGWTSSFSVIAHAPEIVIERVLVDDSVSGNGNMALDPGENADIEVFLMNDGSSPAFAVEMDLSTADPYVTLITTAGAYANLNPGESSSAVFNLEVGQSCPQDYDVFFEGVFYGSHALAGNVDFTLTVGNILYLPTGPDAYGYAAYDFHDAPILPVYEWIEIDPHAGGAGTEIVYTSDDQTFRYDLPFTFRYYGQDYTRVSICNNGWIAMGETNSTDYSNSGIPNGDGPPAMIAPFWEDLSPQIAGSVSQYYDEAEHLYIVEFNDVRQYMPTSAFETFEVILYDPEYYPTVTGDGEIKFQYGELTDPTSATVGIENPAQNTGVEYVYNDDYDEHAWPLENGLAILFTTGREAAEMTFTLTPELPQIVIPAGGGSFDYSLEIANIGQSMAFFTGWLDVDMPGGGVYEVLVRPGLSLGVGASLSRDMSQNVPGGAPEGTYEYWGHAGNYPNTIFAEDSFPFEKSGVDASSANSGWEVDGWDSHTVAIEVPQQFALSQNYPNPFNPATTFNFDIAELSEVSITVFDILGRETAVLTQGMMEPGNYTLEWDAAQNSAGIYFVRMTAGNYTRTVKAVLVK